jgi:hypothetical protein
MRSRLPQEKSNTSVEKRDVSLNGTKVKRSAEIDEREMQDCVTRQESRNREAMARATSRRPSKPHVRAVPEASVGIAASRHWTTYANVVRSR